MINRTFFLHFSSIEFQEKIFDSKNPTTCLVGTTDSNEPDFVSKKIYIRHTKLDPNNEVDFITVKDLFPDSSGIPRLRMFQILPTSLQSWAAPKTRKITEEVSFQKINHKKFSNLTQRNRQVLSLWAQSLKAEEIGEKLFIGVNSVNSHKKRIKEILDVSNSADIIRYGKAFDLF
jgi:DNA-binding CsgD family transcriptional regulator